MITIEDFWKIDDQIMTLWGDKFYDHINYCGLEPIRPLENYGYFCTPKNSLTFACTGGDGVHFGIVNGMNEKGGPGPIVMTVPMADQDNVVVAEDLKEFFSLGYYVGWFGMEHIVYDLDEAIQYFSGPDEELDPEQIKFLEMIRRELSIQYMPLSKGRLSKLESKYFHLLEIGDLDG